MADVVVVGGGIIGFSIANRILRHTNLSVSVVESSHHICAGATGSGQGYIWSGHLNPEAEIWPLARHSKQLWNDFVKDIKDPLQTIGWKNTGSLLFTSNSEHSFALHERLHKLAHAGLEVEYLNSSSAQQVEPALRLDPHGAAGFVIGDAQIDAKLTVQYIQKENKSLGSGGRYKEHFGHPVTGFLWSPTDRYIQGVETVNGEIYSNKALILAAGAWSSGLMQKLCEHFGLSLVPPIKPRKGHLLVVNKPNELQLNHGLMEFTYTFHVGTENEHELGVETTATMDQFGNILLGSSREFKGFDCKEDDVVIQTILARAAKFIPGLSAVSPSTVHARVGLRPYASGGKPMIGPVVELPGLFLASGHEGQGLMLSMATAEMVVNMVEQRRNAVDLTPFLPSGKLQFTHTT